MMIFGPLLDPPSFMMNFREFGPTRLSFMSAVEISDFVPSRMLKGLVACDPSVLIARFLVKKPGSLTNLAD